MTMLERFIRFRLPNIKWVLILTLTVTLLLSFGAIRYASSGSHDGRYLTIPPLSPSSNFRDLVLVVHGYESDPETLSGMSSIVKQTMPNALVLVPRYNCGRFSNADPYHIASELEDAIVKLDARHNFTSITLLGHSIGALLVRKAYVWGHGLTEDRPGFPTTKHSWVDKVQRIVLLAGMNRGWSISPRASKMHLGELLGIWVGKRIGQLTGTGRLILSAERGAPFVADLRVQWIRLARGESGPQVKPVIQLLGDDDNIVSVADSMDLTASKDFIYLPVVGATHAGIVQERDAIAGALADPIDSLRAKTQNISNEDQTVEEVVFVLHGIRDFGSWTEALRQEIERRARSTDRRVVVVTSKYGYFPMGRFLLYGARQTNVRWFMDEYTEVIAQYPRARISFVGHSNGTYILAKALETYTTLRVHRVVFAGSVVRGAFPWRKYSALSGEPARVDDLRNLMASSDWVVGVFPGLYELVGESTRALGLSPGHFDIGAAGFRGFQETVGPHDNVMFIKGGHNAAIDVGDKARHSAISDFVLDGSDEHFKQANDPGKPSIVIDWLSRLCWVVWLALLLIVTWAGRQTRRRAMHFGYSGGVAVSAFLIVILLILYTV